jgi:hypothetical protein
MIEIKNDSQRDEVMLWVSDLYKDVYGIRPRGYDWDSFSNQELEDFVNSLMEMSNRHEEDLANFESRAIESVMSLGVDKLTALKWLDDAEAHYVWNDDEWAVEDMKKYGWEARYKEDDKSYRGAIDLW